MQKPTPAAESTWADGGVASGIRDALVIHLKGSALWSLLLTVARQRAAARSPAEVQRQFEADRFVGPAPVDQRTLRRLELTLLEVADGYEAIELAPLTPLGTCLAVAPGSQDRIVATMRGTEVVSDPTNVMALECARRLRTDPAATVRLATAHRCVRAQAVPGRRGMAAHFGMFCLATAAHESADQTFSAGALADHVLLHLRTLERLEHLAGYDFGRRTVRLLSTPTSKHLALRVEAQVRATHPTLSIAHAPLESAYYDGLRFMIDVGRAPDPPTALIDGGVFDWVGQLAANRKFRFVASAMGTQIAAALFRQ